MARKQIIIPKEKAVFWMDKNGVWHNEHGKFQHRKIIRHFNRSIQKDDQGYHLFQVTDGCEEKVYFPYEDTALFVVNLTLETDIMLTLNTGQTLTLIPAQLFFRNDLLYLQTPGHCIKFSQQALFKISEYMEEKEGRLFLALNGVLYPIPEHQGSEK